MDTERMLTHECVMVVTALFEPDLNRHLDILTITGRFRSRNVQLRQRF